MSRWRPFTHSSLCGRQRGCVDSTTESPEVLEPTRLIPYSEQRLPLPSSSLEEAGVALAVPLGHQMLAQAWRCPLSCSSYHPPPSTLLRRWPTLSGGGFSYRYRCALETGPKGAVGAPLAKSPAVPHQQLGPATTNAEMGDPAAVQQQQQGPATTTVEVGEGDAAAAAALMSMKLGSISQTTSIVVYTGDMFSASRNSSEGTNSSARTNSSGGTQPDIQPAGHIAGATIGLMSAA